ncbi:uncharacterized protein DUF2818 [Paucimonas lemoignei]|uniref:Uncharacterized protein DUF2818 n=1 Tax=Paucimonas lemoignei TaxID=29443 RepID=A0A4R3I1G7_PAULE|nr:DUF2818 family protein [Paucimonas lemoignei]TCS39577.1 uncharacterized protein DUF2818 [Paucimonas lemoignei]
MSAAFSSWFLIGLAVLAANLPFFNERVLAVMQLASLPKKPFWLRLIELIVLYFLVGAIAYMLEARIGSVFKQGWEFYAVTGCFFLVLAFPGFVYRYLHRRHG